MRQIGILHIRRFSTKPRSYSDAIDALNSLQTNFATLEAIRKSERKANSMAIPEMIEWTRRVGYKPSDLDRLNVLHITGTKGKGSTCAFTYSILSQYRPVLSKIGVYTSPHLKSVRERISINGEPISEDKFTRYFFEVWDRLSETLSEESIFPNMGQGVRPVYFRFLTLLSFHVFLSENVDTAIYEVGVGGEYDSTNIVRTPTAVGISNIGIDHTRVLGSTLREIAWNKGGIMKTGTKAFSVEQKAEAWDELQRRADEKNVELIKVPIHPVVAKSRLGIDAEFQKINASLAVTLAREHLRVLGHYPQKYSNDYVLPHEFTQGLEKASWAGRCQTIRDGKTEWLLDGAHTDESITVAAQWFSTKSRSTAKNVLIFNQQTRDAKSLVERLHSILAVDVHFDEVIFCTNLTWSAGGYQAAELTSMNTSQQAVHDLVVQKELAEQWEKLDPASRRFVLPTIEDAVKHVRDLKDDDVQVFVTGSLHLVGGLLVVLDK
ncbi:Mur ligase [Lipomyces orientalis]|uniref:Mur ligase n=1 Tax=Lipomyces orientalis TaxID=1233043 RepID=A0ACC3TFN4_9ASCO